MGERERGVEGEGKGRGMGGGGCLKVYRKRFYLINERMREGRERVREGGRERGDSVRALVVRKENVLKYYWKGKWFVVIEGREDNKREEWDIE